MLEYWSLRSCFSATLQVTIPVKGVEQLKQSARRCGCKLLATVLADLKAAGPK